MKRLLIIVALVLLGAYSALWYLSSRWLADHVTQREYSYVLPNVRSSGHYKFDQMGYSGFWRGKAGLKISFKEASFEQQVSLGSTNQQIHTVGSMRPADGEMLIEVSAPIFGSAVTFTPLGLSTTLEFVSKKNDEAPQNFKIATKGGRTTIKHRTPSFLILRDSLIGKESDLKHFVRDFEALEVEEFETSLFKGGDVAPLLITKGNGLSLKWGVKEDGMFALGGHIDSELEFGEGFSKMVYEAQRQGRSDEAFRLGQIIFEGVFGEKLTGFMRGDFGFTLPAKLLSLSDQAHPPGYLNFPPLSFYLKDLTFKFPFFIGGERTLNLNAAFVYDNGKPIEVFFSSTDKGEDFKPTLDRIMSRFKAELPEEAAKFNFDKLNPEDFSSLSELEGSQGALAMVYSGFKFYSEILSSPGTFELKTSIKTNSGNFTPFEMFGAQSSFELLYTLGSLSSLRIKGNVNGLQNIVVNGSFEHPLKLARLAAPVIKIFVARSLAAIYFVDVDSESPFGGEEEKKLIDFVFSERLENRVIQSLEKLIALVDLDPSTKDVLEMRFESGPSGVRINGVDSKTLDATLQEAGKKESSELEAFFKSELESIVPGLSQKFEAGSKFE